MRAALRSIAVSGLAVAAVVAAGCGSSSSSSTGAAQAPAPPIQPAAPAAANGNVTWCIGKDTTGSFKTAITQFNAANPQAKAKLVELPEEADQQRTQLIQRLQAKSPECDVLGIDVIWTAEFASQGWLQDVSPLIEQRKAEFIPSTVETANFEGKYWAVPYNSNAGFLYYRKDVVPQAPTTWEDVYTQAQQDKGIVYQGRPYEGLTVNFLELLYSAGGKVLSDDGKTPAIDSPEARSVLDFMAKGIADGAAPKAVTTYNEDASRRAFEAGQATFMRNWPYAYALGNQSPIKGKFGIANFPGFEGKPGAGVLGGYNLAISAYSKNVPGAQAFINYLTAPPFQKTIAIEASLPPTVASVYDDPAVKKALPFAEQLRQAISQAQPRPVSPVYPQISEAIYKNVSAALSGRTSSDDAVKKMSDDINKALNTF